ncbi:mCG146268, partial [Mus musculus]
LGCAPEPQRCTFSRRLWETQSFLQDFKIWIQLRHLKKLHVLWVYSWELGTLGLIYSMRTLTGKEGCS